MPRKKKHDEPVILGMDFDKALDQSGQGAPFSIQPPTTDDDGPVHLLEDDTGDRFLTYVTKGGVRQEVRYAGSQPWFTQKQLAQMFGVNTDTVGDHIKVFQDAGELAEATTGNFPVVQLEGSREVRRDTKHYTLDVAFYVGYRVNSAEGVLFRKWATAILVRFATKGFVVDKVQLKGQSDRIAELREIIRDIRNHEANIYAELRQICSMCADYDPTSKAAHDFYAHMQAKLYWAVVSHTPSEIIRARINADNKDLGLHTWAGDKVVQSDALNAKNALAPAELKELNRVTDILLSVFEDQADVGRLTIMRDAEQLLDKQLEQLGRAVLRHGGSISSIAAREHAKAQYKIFDNRRKAAEKAKVDAELTELKKLSRPKRRQTN